MVRFGGSYWWQIINSSQRHWPFFAFCLGSLEDWGRRTPLVQKFKASFGNMVSPHLNNKIKIKCTSLNVQVIFQELRPPEFGIMPWVIDLDTHKIHMLHLIMRFSLGLQLAFAAGVLIREDSAPKIWKKKTPSIMEIQCPSLFIDLFRICLGSRKDLRWIPTRTCAVFSTGLKC